VVVRRRFALAALVVGLAALGWAVFVPGVRVVTSDGAGSVSLAESEGWRPVLLGLVPVLAAAGAWVGARSRGVVALCAAVATILALLSAASIGLFLLPSALLLVAAALLPQSIAGRERAGRP
jgi:hypothetical protein